MEQKAEEERRRAEKKRLEEDARAAAAERKREAAERAKQQAEEARVLAERRAQEIAAARHKAELARLEAAEAAAKRKAEEDRRAAEAKELRRLAIKKNQDDQLEARRRANQAHPLSTVAPVPDCPIVSIARIAQFSEREISDIARQDPSCRTSRVRAAGATIGTASAGSTPPVRQSTSATGQPPSIVRAEAVQDLVPSGPMPSSPDLSGGAAKMPERATVTGFRPTAAAPRAADNVWDRLQQDVRVSGREFVDDPAFKDAEITGAIAAVGAVTGCLVVGGLSGAATEGALALPGCGVGAVAGAEKALEVAGAVALGISVAKGLEDAATKRYGTGVTEIAVAAAKHIVGEWATPIEVTGSAATYMLYNFYNRTPE